MGIFNLITEKSRAFEQQLIGIRRDLHQYPELSNREFRTSEKVAAFLKSLGPPVQIGVANTGVVALLQGAHAGPGGAIRADIAALPINVPSEVLYSSPNL